MKFSNASISSSIGLTPTDESMTSTTGETGGTDTSLLTELVEDPFDQLQLEGQRRRVTRSSSISSSSNCSNINDTLSRRSANSSSTCSNSRRRTIFPTVQLIRSTRDDSSLLTTPPTSPHGSTFNDDEDDDHSGRRTRPNVVSPSNLLIESGSFASSSLSSVDSSIRHSYMKQFSRKEQQRQYNERTGQTFTTGSEQNNLNKSLNLQTKVESTPRSKNTNYSTSYSAIPNSNPNITTSSNTFQPIILESDLVMNHEDSLSSSDKNATLENSIPQSPIALSLSSSNIPSSSIYKTSPQKVHMAMASSMQGIKKDENPNYSFSSSSSSLPPPSRAKSSSPKKMTKTKKINNDTNTISTSSTTTNTTMNIASSSSSPTHHQTQSLEKSLFHLLHSNQVHNPSIKEFKESWSFASAVQNYYSKDNIQLILDVAGGHGALCALLLILLPQKRNSSSSSSLHGVVIDPAENIHNGVQKAWNDFYRIKVGGGRGEEGGKDLQDVLTYRHEDLRTGLRKEIDSALNMTCLSPKQILVVACHACQHLSDETLKIACSYGVHVAVMPCCQKDVVSGGSFKELSKRLNMNIGVLMDLLTVGKVMSWNNGREKGVKYQVKVKLIDEKITPQNRIILCRAKKLNEDDLEEALINDAHNKLTRAYHRAHRNTKKSVKRMCYTVMSSICMKSVGVGLVTGVIISFALRRRK